MLSRQEEMQDRNEYLENEKRLRAQGTTFARFAQSEAAEARGRFSAISNPTVIGSTPTPASAYPAAFLQHDPVPDEPALGIDVNALEPVGEPHELKASIASLGPSLPSAKATPPAPQQAPPLARRAGGLSSRSYRRF